MGLRTDGELVPLMRKAEAGTLSEQDLRRLSTYFFEVKGLRYNEYPDFYYKAKKAEAEKVKAEKAKAEKAKAEKAEAERASRIATEEAECAEEYDYLFKLLLIGDS